MEEILTKLQDDSLYYGEYGKQWLSNSDIYTLLNDPKSFRQSKEQTKAMLEGRYFHVAMLEPEKLSSFQIVDVASRNTKAYKELAEETGEMMLLLKEKEHLDKVINSMKANMDMFVEIYETSNQYEVPNVKIINNEWWKGKADIICTDKIIDLKTTSDLNKFRQSAYRYNYDSQAYIYQKLFDKPLEFYVIDKSTLQLAVFTTSPEFLERGKAKVEQAVYIYNKFFSKTAKEEINTYVHHEIL
tara:strand:+ start:8025 stop:8753 length:729 start_codon:yes stop_codon:yes gene_type:complete